LLKHQNEALDDCTSLPFVYLLFTFVTKSYAIDTLKKSIGTRWI